MKLGKKQIVNGIIIIGVMLLLFTPIGFRVKVYVSRLLSTGAAMVKAEIQVPLDTYQWQLMDLEGIGFDFEKERGNVVLVNFWATWCAPCVAEMPSLQKLYDDYGDKVTFMLVAQDEYEKVTGFIQQKNYNLPVYYSKTDKPKVLDSKLLPTTYVISKKGNIIVAETGAADWNSSKTRSLLDKLLKE